MCGGVKSQFAAVGTSIDEAIELAKRGGASSYKLRDTLETLSGVEEVVTTQLAQAEERAQSAERVAESAKRAAELAKVEADAAMRRLADAVKASSSEGSETTVADELLAAYQSQLADSNARTSAAVSAAVKAAEEEVARAMDARDAATTRAIKAEEAAAETKEELAKVQLDLKATQAELEEGKVYAAKTVQQLDDLLEGAQDNLARTERELKLKTEEAERVAKEREQERQKAKAAQKAAAKAEKSAMAGKKELEVAAKAKAKAEAEAELRAAKDEAAKALKERDNAVKWLKARVDSAGEAAQHAADAGSAATRVFTAEAATAEAEAALEGATRRAERAEHAALSAMDAVTKAKAEMAVVIRETSMKADAALLEVAKVSKERDAALHRVSLVEADLLEATAESASLRKPFGKVINFVGGIRKKRDA